MDLVNINIELILSFFKLFKEGLDEVWLWLGACDSLRWWFILLNGWGGPVFFMLFVGGGLAFGGVGLVGGACFNMVKFWFMTGVFFHLKMHDDEW